MEPTTEIVVYRSPDWRGPEGQPAPGMAYEYEALLEQAETALARRQEAYPAMIARGQITAEDAEADIAAWQLLAAEWRWICDGTGELPHPSTLPARIAAVDLAMERAGAQLARGGRSDDLMRQVALITAMRWQLDRLRDGAPAVHHFADLTRRVRRAIEQRQANPDPSPANGKELS